MFFIGAFGDDAERIANDALAGDDEASFRFVSLAPSAVKVGKSIGSAGGTGPTLDVGSSSFSVFVVRARCDDFVDVSLFVVDFFFRTLLFDDFDVFVVDFRVDLLVECFACEFERRSTLLLLDDD